MKKDNYAYLKFLLMDDQIDIDSYNYGTVLYRILVSYYMFIMWKNAMSNSKAWI